MFPSPQPRAATCVSQWVGYLEGVSLMAGKLNETTHHLKVTDTHEPRLKDK